MKGPVKGIIFAVDETASHDGPGLRMNVYLKGCPLRCAWCHSPESISPEPEVVWYSAKCKKCNECSKACPDKIISFGRIDPELRNKCKKCRRMCLRACMNGALEVKGKETTALEIAEYAEKLAPFFRRSGGGITITGGEPAFQMDFTVEVLKLCRSKGMHTAVETSGYAQWKVFEKIAEVTDLFLFDIKHPDDKLHRAYTGVSNSLIFGNLARLIKKGANVVVRLPLIPGYNDSLQTVRETAGRIKETGVIKVSLLPFNPASAGKYSWLNLAYPLSGAKPQPVEYIKELETIAVNAGLEVVHYG